jgi:hypothetical protein
MKKKAYHINDMQDFCNGLRNLANAFVCELLGCDLPEDELKEYCTVGMVAEIVLHFAKPNKNRSKWKIKDGDVDKVIEVVSDDIYQAMLSKMAATDMVEVCYDSETEAFHLYKKKIDSKGVRHFGEELGLGLAEIAWEEMEEGDEQND